MKMNSDELINFNGWSIHLGLFYVQRLEKIIYKHIFDP